MSFYNQAGVLIFGSRLKRLSDTFLNDLNKFYNSKGVRFEASWFPIFYLLSQSDSLSIKNISEELNVSHSAASQLVSNLQEKGYLKSVVDKTDARKKMVTLTPKGQKILKQVTPIWEAIENAMNEFLVEGPNSKNMLLAISEMEKNLEEKTIFERMKKHYK